MKEETFYRKYANLPIPKRHYTFTLGSDQNVNMRAYTPFEVYCELNKLTDVRRVNNQAIKDLLAVAEKILH